MTYVLSNYVRDNFTGILVFGDIHSEYDSLRRAHDYAEAHNYFFMSLGDLVDRGLEPFETVLYMHNLINLNKAGFTIGNHDDKYRRFYKGSKVRFSEEAKMTLTYVGDNRQSEFLEKYTEIVEHPIHSSMFHIFDDIVLTHAASHSSMWDSTQKFSKEAHARALVGEVSGEVYSNGYPVRLYNWVEEIPIGKTVIVGHDRSPIFNILISEPLVRSNKNGGKAIFLDTGCGKGGHLTGAVILLHNNKFKFDSFVDFK